MPRYYFDLTDGSRDPDDLGCELRDRAAAELEAIRYLGEILKNEPDRLRRETLRIEVREEGGHHPFRVAVIVEKAGDD